MAGVTTQQIYQELLSLGASTTQAIGIMANMINESGFDPEAIGDQGTSFGLVQQHGNYGYLVTGNPAKDMAAQLRLLVQNGGLSAASGSSAAQAAGNFAANYERCVGCQPGGAQYNSRVGNVDSLLTALRTGKWPTSGGSGGGSGGGGGGGSSGGEGGGSGGGSSGGTGLYGAWFSDYPGTTQTTSFLGDVFSTIEDPFKAIGDAVKTLTQIFSSPFIGFLDVFKFLVTGVNSLINSIDTIIKDLLWLFNPSHWVRIFCFIFGVFVAIPALYALMHTGTGDLYLAMGIFLTVAAAVLFFLAFHNLPYEGPGSAASSTNVINLQSLLAYITAGVTGGGGGKVSTVAATQHTADMPSSGSAAGFAGVGQTGSGFSQVFKPVKDATGIFPTISNITPTPSGNPPAYTNYLL